MQIGTKVIRKVDATRISTAFGVIDRLTGNKAYVRWLYNGHQQHSTLSINALMEVSPEMEQELRKGAKAKYEERQRQLDAERTHLCTNTDKHRRPLPLLPSQVVDGKCFYCGHPAVVRERYQEGTCDNPTTTTERA